LGVFRGNGVLLIFEPVRARSHDDFVALLFVQAIFAQDAGFVFR
jgi:hypothetical protein